MAYCVYQRLRGDTTENGWIRVGDKKIEDWNDAVDRIRAMNYEDWIWGTGGNDQPFEEYILEPDFEYRIGEVE